MVNVGGRKAIKSDNLRSIGRVYRRGKMGMERNPQSCTLYHCELNRTGVVISGDSDIGSTLTNSMDNHLIIHTYDGSVTTVEC